MTTEHRDDDASRIHELVESALEQPRPFEQTLPKDDWLSAVLGRFKDDPEFDAIVEAGKEFRSTGILLEDQHLFGGDSK